MKPYSASPFPEVGDVPPTPDVMQRAALGHLAILRDRGDLTDEDFTEIGEALGLIPTDVDERPRRGHIKGDRLRAVPADWKREGARAP